MVFNFINFQVHMHGINNEYINIIKTASITGVSIVGPGYIVGPACAPPTQFQISLATFLSCIAVVLEYTPNIYIL